MESKAVLGHFKFIFDVFFQGALVGGVTGLISMAWWCLSAQMAIARGQIVHPHKPLTTVGCTYNFTIPGPGPPIDNHME